MIGQVLAAISALFILTGSVFGVLAAIGLLRFPDFYTRLHAVSLACGTGAGLILLAVALAVPDAGIALRAILGAVFLMLTAPVSSHLLARISHRYKRVDSLMMQVDDLRTKI